MRNIVGYVNIFRIPVPLSGRTDRLLGIKKVICAVLCWLLATAALSSGLKTLAAEKDIVDPYTTYSYEILIEDLRQLEERYPELISAFSIGRSVEGRELCAFSLGRGSKTIIMCSSTHAREHITTNFVMYMAEQYAKGFYLGARYNGKPYRDILDSVKFLIVPMLNPDGVNLAQFGPGAVSDPALIEGMRFSEHLWAGYDAWKANINGVDLNRNYPYNWKAVTPDNNITKPSSAGYSGPYAGSEPETRAMLSLLENIPFWALCSFHISGEVIYWADNGTPGLTEKHRPIAERISDAIGYRLKDPENVRTFGGYMCNYARNTYGRFCMTVELCPSTVEYPYPANNFSSIENIYTVGLALASEVMGFKGGVKSPGISVDGKNIVFPDQQPYSVNGSVLVPLRAAAEACGLSVTWNADSGTASVSDEYTEVVLTPGSDVMRTSSQDIYLPFPVELRGGRVSVPVRALFEYFGFQVGWDSRTGSVYISSNR